MRCVIVNEDTGERRVEEREPICGEDYCDTCGDCLHCYGDSGCADGGEHSWVRYENKHPETGEDDRKQS